MIDCMRSILQTSSSLGTSYPASRSNLQHTRLSLTFFVFPFSVSSCCLKLALPAFGGFSVEDATHNNSLNLFTTRFLFILFEHIVR